jgi:hypothetical protein
MMMARLMRASILLRIVCVLGVGACSRSGTEGPVPNALLTSEEKLLERQVGSLRSAIADAKKGVLFSPDDIAVGVSESVVQATIAQALPMEKPIDTEFRARIDRAVVSFRSMQGSIRLEGRVWALADPGTYADLFLVGGIESVRVDQSTGTLEATIVLDGWDVQRAAAVGAEMDWIKDLAHLLGDRGLDELRELVPLVRIPVGVEQGIDLPGLSGGPVVVPAGRLPLDASVTRVLPLSGRLWVMVGLRSGGWRKAP